MINHRHSFICTQEAIQLAAFFTATAESLSPVWHSDLGMIIAAALRAQLSIWGFSESCPAR
jgi:hypothetical protein